MNSVQYLSDIKFKTQLDKTNVHKFGNALEKCGFGRYQHKSLFFGANTLK